MGAKFNQNRSNRLGVMGPLSWSGLKSSIIGPKSYEKFSFLGLTFVPNLIKIGQNHLRVTVKVKQPLRNFTDKLNAKGSR